MWIDDLTRAETIGGPAGLVYVGWLDDGYPFPLGSVDHGFFARLHALCRNPWRPPHTPATSPLPFCPLCRFSNGPPYVRYENSEAATGQYPPVYVPGHQVVYVAPPSILHYIDAHQYLPPRPFLEAVNHCPEMRSGPYLRALVANGPRQLFHPEEGE
jgi:hypothetical protein